MDWRKWNLLAQTDKAEALQDFFSSAYTTEPIDELGHLSMAERMIISPAIINIQVNN